MKNCNRDENICANEISLSKEEYIATVNAYSNSLTSEIVNVDCDSVSTIESIVTPYTESVTSNIESEVSMTSSALDRLQFTSENSSTTESALTYASSDLDRLQFSSENNGDRSGSISTINSIATPYTESVTSNIESEVSMTSSALDRLQFSSENSSTTPYPESVASNTISELTYTSSALEELRFPSPDETDFPSSIELTGTTTENYWKDFQLLGLYNIHGTRNGAPCYKRSRNAFMLGRDPNHLRFYYLYAIDYL